MHTTPSTCNQPLLINRGCFPLTTVVGTIPERAHLSTPCLVAHLQVPREPLMLWQSRCHHRLCSGLHGHLSDFTKALPSGPCFFVMLIATDRIIDNVTSNSNGSSNQDMAAHSNKKCQPSANRPLFFNTHRHPTANFELQPRSQVEGHCQPGTRVPLST